jgi:hypothetical protein
LDTSHWGPDWTIRTVFEQRVAQAIEGEAWVLDGNYQSVRNSVWVRATAIVWLNFSFPVVFSRAMSRTLRRIVGGSGGAGGEGDEGEASQDKGQEEGTRHGRASFITSPRDGTMFDPPVTTL